VTEDSSWPRGRNDKEKSESGHILKAEQARFPNGWDVKHEQKIEVKNDSMGCLFCPSLEGWDDYELK
jgi:hypothetical protein